MSRAMVVFPEHVVSAEAFKLPLTAIVSGLLSP